MFRAGFAVNIYMVDGSGGDHGAALIGAVTGSRGLTTTQAAELRRRSPGSGLHPRAARHRRNRYLPAPLYIMGEVTRGGQ